MEDVKNHFWRKLFVGLGKKNISHKNATLHKPQLLILAPTGVAAINVAGITMQTPMETFGKSLPELNDKMKLSLRNKLCEICSDNRPFTILFVIAVGDLISFLQLQEKLLCIMQQLVAKFWASMEIFFKLINQQKKCGNMRIHDLLTFWLRCV